MVIKKEIDSNTVIVENVNNPLTSMDSASRRKIKKRTTTLYDIPGQMNFNTLRGFHPKVAEYRLFSSPHETFSGIDYMLKHKRSINKVKKIEII